MDLIRTFDAMEDKDIDLRSLLEERFVFYECVPTLLQIACHEVALKLWHHYITYNKSKKKRGKTDDLLAMAYGLDENYQSDSDKLVKFLNVPGCVEEMLAKSLFKIRTEMKTWILYFKKKMFKGELTKYCVRDFNPNNCVWFQNGKIDYKKTAMKMLAEAKLTSVQKFVIMSLHAMADEINMFPSFKLPECFSEIGYIVFEIQYWIPHCRDQVIDIMVKLFSVMRGEVENFGVIMAFYCAKRLHPSAFEYFWKQLDEEDQISVAMKVLPETMQLQKIILSGMSLYQQRELMSKIPVVLMVNFCIELEMPEYALKVWLHARDQTTEEQFASLVRPVYECAISSENCISVLIEIWDTAPKRLRNYVAENAVGDIFEAFLFSSRPTSSSSKFCCRVLLLISARMRKQLIFKYAALFAKNIDNPNSVMDVMELCLPTDSEQIKFKKVIMESSVLHENFIELINAVKFDELNQKLSFYSSDDRLTRNLMKKLLKSDEIEEAIFIIDYKKWNMLSNFLLKIFANDLSTISKLKKHLISSFSSEAFYYWKKSDKFRGIVKVLEQEFSHVELETYKQNLLKNFQKRILTSKQFWQYFDGNCFNTFVFWCLGDGKKVLDFKMLVPVDEVFDDVFGNICGWYAMNRSEYEPQYLLNKLDAFLRCLCPSHEEIKKFKIRKFNGLNQHMFQETWLNSADRAWYTILMWFFENDEDEVVNFQANDSNNRRKRKILNLMVCFR